jgi:hypothetical protein
VLAGIVHDDDDDDDDDDPSMIRPLGLFRFRTYFLKLMDLFR